MMAKSAVVALQQWLGETFSHAIGNPREEKLYMPPSIGPQPYHDIPHKSW